MRSGTAAGPGPAPERRGAAGPPVALSPPSPGPRRSCRCPPRPAAPRPRSRLPEGQWCGRWRSPGRGRAGRRDRGSSPGGLGRGWRAGGAVTGAPAAAGTRAVADGAGGESGGVCAAIGPSMAVSAFSPRAFICLHWRNAVNPGFDCL